MNWAWHQDLRPVPKLILIALADAVVDLDHPLVRKLLDTRHRLQIKKRQGD